LFALQLGAEPLGALDKLVMAAGAGFHEEVVFRGVTFAGGAALLQRFGGLNRWAALAWAAIGSAMLFAAVHHLGPMADLFTWPRFTFRALAGMFLSGLFAWRGFAVAVYTHALYDMLVFFSFGA
jgi:membrane protease YdiL (CAAX protease family)